MKEDGRKLPVCLCLDFVFKSFSTEDDEGNKRLLTSYYIQPSPTFIIIDFVSGMKNGWMDGWMDG